MQTPSHPLTADHLAVLNGVLSAIPTTRELIAKCKLCGLDVDQAEQMTEQQHQLATKLKQAFFPHEP